MLLDAAADVQTTFSVAEVCRKPVYVSQSNSSRDITVWYLNQNSGILSALVFEIIIES